METMLNISVLIATFFGMEFMAWFTHKFVMHGFLWYFHKDHHTGEHGLFQKNDAFFLIFAIPSWLCIMLGMMYQNQISVMIGAGIAVYGLAYFFVHDVFIHRRLSWFEKAKHPYFRAIRKAHAIHHRNQGKHEGQCFGMLFVPFKFYKQALEEERSLKNTSQQ